MSDRPAEIIDRVPLGPYTTLKIGGPAKYFIPAKNQDDIRRAIDWADRSLISWTVFGGGSNTLVADTGYDGLVILMTEDTLRWEPPRVVVAAGVKLGQLISGGLQHQLGGMRWLIGVPGTVGGAVYGNAGSKEWGIGDQVEWVEILDEHGDVRRLVHTECDFGYRTSIFKRRRVVILRTQLLLPTVDPQIERTMLASTAAEKNAKQPTTASSAGCMFTNPLAPTDQLPEELRSSVAPDGTMPAWKCITAVGLAGFQLGHVQISPKHANFMVNLGGATADEVVQLLSLVKQKVRDTLGVQLHEEVQYLGF